ncbi:hypothetical protein TN53_11855 [Streptomyces sp. WM6386]|nr:hypothetical protein TN53_11855 [Streptomyces sp. WM6386]
MLNRRLVRLGGIVKRLRERADLTQAEAAELIGVNRGTWISMENGTRRPQISKILAVADKLEATPGEREKLLALAAKPQEPGWMRPLRGRLPEAYSELIEIERDARLIQAWEPTMPHGLLQTPNYARAHARRSLLEATDERVEARVIARVSRQATFTARDDAHLSVVLGEAALHYQVGGPDVHHEQLQHLLTASHQPNITLQIMPFAGGAHACMMGSFTIFAFTDDDPPVGYLETPASDYFLDDETPDLAHLLNTYPKLKADALPPAESRELITTTLQHHERRTQQNGLPFALAQE